MTQRASLPEVDRWTISLAIAALIALVAVTAAGGAAAAVVFLLGPAAATCIAAAVADAGDRPFVLRATLIALSGRAMVMCGLHWILVARGTGGSMFFDDAGYVLTARALSHLWRGVPVSADELGLIADISFAPGFVAFAAAVFSVLGENIVALKVLNTVIGVLWGSLVYRTMRNLQLPGARVATLVILAFPSLALWSSLVLKDAIAGLLMLTAVWSVSEWHRGARWAWVVTIVTLAALRDFRVYVFVIIALSWPLAVLVARRRPNIVGAIGALAASLVLIVSHDAAVTMLDVHVINGLASTRESMAQYARSAFVKPPPVAVAAPGQQFLVEVPGSTCDPALPQRIHEVPAGSELDVEGAATAPPVPGSSRPRVISVRSCDIVILVSADAAPRTTVSGEPPPITPRPARTQLPVVRVEPERVNVVATPQPASASDDLGAGAESNLRHLPIGMLYVLTAPFPLAARTLAESAFLPEMLLWYSLLVFAGIGAWRVVTGREARLVLFMSTFIGIFLVLSLTEGNVGTLVRHRAMLVPYVVVLAAYGAVIARPHVAALTAKLRVPSIPAR
jgi:hypothetical protein